MFTHGAGGAYHVPLDRQLPALRGFLSPGHATNDEMAMRQRHFLMAHLLVTALCNLADRWQLLAPFYTNEVYQKFALRLLIGSLASSLTTL